MVVHVVSPVPVEVVELAAPPVPPVLLEEEEDPPEPVVVPLSLPPQPTARAAPTAPSISRAARRFTCLGARVVIWSPVQGRASGRAAAIGRRLPGRLSGAP